MRVHVIGFADITRHRHAGIFHTECAALLVADRGPAVILHGLHLGRVVAGSVTSLIVCQLDEVEWEIALAPQFAPGADHRTEVALILEGIIIAIGFTLIPDRAADGIRDHRVDHAIEDGRCLFLILLVIGCHFLVRLKRLSRHPWFDACAAPGTLD